MVVGQVSDGVGLGGGLLVSRWVTEPRCARSGPGSSAQPGAAPVCAADTTSSEKDSLQAARPAETVFLARIRRDFGGLLSSGCRRAVLLPTRLPEQWTFCPLFAEPERFGSFRAPSPSEMLILRA